MKYTFDTEFRIGDIIYHKIPGSPVGMITGISYSVVSGNLTYYITFDPQAGEVTCFEWELSQTKTVE